MDVSHPDCSFKSPAVNEVMLSPEGDTLYSICSDERSCEATVLRLSNREILMPKRSFAFPSLFFVPMKEGVLLCMGIGEPELWNFELTRCMRPLSKLSGYEKLTLISQELIACQSQDHSFEGTDIPDVVVYYPPEETSKGSSNPVKLYLRGSTTFKLLKVDIFNVTSGEFIYSGKTKVFCEENIEFVYFNIRGDFLVCTCEEIDDDLFDTTELKIWLRKNDSQKNSWERKSRKYFEEPFWPRLIISPKEEFVVTWGSLDAGCGLHILDARCGVTRHNLLKNRVDIVDCKFACDDESLLCCTSDNFLRLFQIRTGDLLCVLDIKERPFSLGVCAREDLIAVGLSSGRLKFIPVELPRRKESERKGITVMDL